MQLLIPTLAIVRKYTDTIEYRSGKLRERIIQRHIGHNLIAQTDSQWTQRKPAIIHNDDFINQMAIFIHFIHDCKYRCISNM